ncbi:protein reticulata-related 4 [Quercus suber]|uniref:Protein reticulata-related 4 n=1 Tax=Quercus suber TaxID=58331 RepID=A0AAW0KD91_QUESU
MRLFYNVIFANHSLQFLLGFPRHLRDDDNNNNNGNSDRGGRGGGGGGDEGSSAKDKNREEALMVLAKVGRLLKNLPKDLAAAIKAGRVPGAVVSTFLELEKLLVLRWLMQFSGFKERLMADDIFLTKSLIYHNIKDPIKPFGQPIHLPLYALQVKPGQTRIKIRDVGLPHKLCHQRHHFFEIST